MISPTEVNVSEAIAVITDPVTPWLRVLADVLPGRPITFRQGADSFSLWESRSLLFGRRMTAVPLGSAGAPTVSLLAAAVQYAEQYRCALVLRDYSGRGVSSDHWLVQGIRSHVIVPLADDPAVNRTRLSGSRRHNLVDAETNGLRFHRRSAQEWRPFYELYRRRMHEIGTPAYSSRLCTAIARHTADTYSYAYVTMRNNDSVIAAALVENRDQTQCVVLQGDAALYRVPCAPTVFLYWKLIEQGAFGGFKQIDLGRSVPGSGVERFKLRFGGEIEPVTDWCYVPTGLSVPTLDRTQYPILTTIWPKLPIGVANVLGPWIAARAS